MAEDAASYMKTLGHQGRLMILAHLRLGEKSVGELERLLNIRQAAVSQQLARLREEGIVETRRDGKTVFYRLKDPKTSRMVTILAELFNGHPA
ncbi:MAG: metalloregulator ArsR/SmtB family transcription factor [Pseudomonadota bacterium]